MTRKSDAILKLYMNSLEYKRNLINFIELKPNIVRESEAENSGSTKNLSGNLNQYSPSELENSIPNNELTVKLGQSSEEDNLITNNELSENLDQSSGDANLQNKSCGTDNWDTNSKFSSKLDSEADNLDPFGDQNYDQNPHEIHESENDIQHFRVITRSRKKENGKKSKRKHELRVCYICGKQTTNYTDHLLTHRNDRDLKCDKCDKLVSNRVALKKHQNFVHNPNHKKHVCDMCGLSLSGKHVLARHIRSIHFGIRTFECTVCNKLFENNYNLKLHQMKHTGEKPYKCKTCPAQFTCKIKFREHKMNEHNIQPPKLFNCDKCNLTFVYNYQLLRHYKTPLHEAGGIFKCEICLEEFKMHSMFTRHMSLKHGATHSKRKNLDVNVKCKVCNKEFKQLRYLRQHERLHKPGGKKYKCEVCGKSFLFNASLREHLRQHTGERAKCEICSDSFINFRKLRKHIKAEHSNTI